MYLWPFNIFVEFIIFVFGGFFQKPILYKNEIPLSTECSFALNKSLKCLLYDSMIKYHFRLLYLYNFALMTLFDWSRLTMLLWACDSSSTAFSILSAAMITFSSTISEKGSYLRYVGYEQNFHVRAYEYTTLTWAFFYPM